MVWKSCRLFARTVLASAQPGALLITGDLTDAKLKVGRGMQLEEEWQVGSALSNWATCPGVTIILSKGNGNLLFSR